jgi:hypothetical protein
VAIHNNRLTITGQWLTDTVSRNQDFNGNTSAPTRFANARLKGHINYFVGMRRVERKRLACGAASRRCP